ncbi:tyrosine-protein phosphatase non-receptor type 4-like [Amphibalanus amphitrite]|uniref:tyrosine-protein phosphatase non-receptor type 4-like n=1 Tax=Amphibalanus amphitrite TaxID=1232801 RepID=UPI001C911876|nr:tyrosine-protein phosphatase non-receptor type 4-like [Amphibalanus amphitrite]XP_043227641.1 tyrosine-protein phosphatase non-receptor type 4-like [Amphibalanus amphitrite]XP_043227642.1 tyrosine-protein phosphatase non-receptor type 4-like [Amphibalanus amphitrite]XP_043227643.1 tyrosine-protein phosphatase non-receptor type 4-like [Amphibalanus amphitrite]
MLESVSRRAFGGSSGTYNVRDSELARERQVRALPYTVLFLDNSQHVFHIEKKGRGQALLDRVYQHLELIERDYFSLQFCDSENDDQVMRWLDPRKPLRRQVAGKTQPTTYHFRVKFYVGDPSKLHEEYTRYHFCLQLRRDVLEGLLPVPPNTACLLASFVLQAELGDYCPEEHPAGYLSRVQLLPNMTEDMEKKITELHARHRGLTPADAEFYYLEHVKRLEMYGLELHRAKDSSGRDIQLGVASVGLVVFQNKKKINTFSWAKIVKIAFKRKEFFIQLRRELSEDYDSLLGFSLPSYRASKALWKTAVEHHTFFRLNAPQPPVRRLMGLGSRFRFSGRTEYQTLQEGRHRARLDRPFVRSGPQRGGPLHQTLPPLSSEERQRLLGHGRLGTPTQHRVTAAQPSRPEPRRAWTEDSPPSDGSFLERLPPLQVPLVVGPAGMPSVGDMSPHKAAVAPVHPSSPPPPPPSSAAGPDPTLLTDTARPFTPAAPGKLSYMDDSEESDKTQESASAASTEPSVSNGHTESPCGSQVVIHMKPDDQGRYGFNVKGGAESSTPVTVSKVAPNAPADRTTPRLSEGDQVVLINGVDVSGLSHDEVVSFIRSSRERHSELVLTVRPSVNYEGSGGDGEEPLVQYVPDTPYVSLSLPDGDPLAQSMLMLSEALAGGAARSEFEKLPRRAPGLSMDDCRLPGNLAKNRYRDISPYDATRVLLTSAESGDYINANYVNMEVPGSGVVNRYIAAQGPLKHTTDDFWSMVWEQQSPLVVMLTTLVEQGRVKCHQYWPPPGESRLHGHLRVSTASQQLTDSFAFREITLVCEETGEERHISHMQYVSWPDHGVPEQPADFVQFVQRVRAARAGLVEPTVVHCSAGIGRTGVLILMETAMCLIEANQPVYPLELVRTMRRQRAMMIQTPSQYQFVCQAVLQVYQEGTVRPLPEYTQR